MKVSHDIIVILGWDSIEGYMLYWTCYNVVGDHIQYMKYLIVICSK